MEFEQYKPPQIEVEEFRSQHKSFSAKQVQEKTSDLSNFINEIDISIQNLSEIMNKILISLQNGADIKILLTNSIFPKIIEQYQNFFDNYFDTHEDSNLSSEIELFFQLINEISILSDEECHSILQDNKIPQLIQKVFSLKKNKNDSILSLLITSIFNLVYQKPLTTNLFYNNDFLNKFYDIYTNYFFLSHHSLSDSLTSLYLVFRSFELVIFIIISNPKDNKEIFDRFFHRIHISIQNILKKNVCENKDDVYNYQLKMISHQILTILSNKEISVLDDFCQLSFLSSLTFLLQYEDTEVVYSFLKIIRVLSESSHTASFVLLKNKDFFNFRTDVNNFEIFQAYCSTWIQILNSLLNADKSVEGRKEYTIIILKKIVPKLFQYFHLADQVKENQNNLTNLFIIFTCFDDKLIIENVIKGAPNIIERIENKLNEKNEDKIIEASKGFFNIIKYYKSSKIIQKTISQDLLNHQENIVKKLKGVEIKKVTELLKEVKITQNSEEESQNEDLPLKNEKASNEIEDKIIVNEDLFPKYIEEKNNFYYLLIRFLENSDDNDLYILLQEIEEQQVTEDKINFEIFLRLIINIANNHQRGNNFIYKIKEIIKYISNQIQETFSNAEIFDIVKSNKLILHNFIENKILTIDDNIFKEMKEMNYCHFFYPEIELFISESEKKDLENQMLTQNSTIFDNYEEKRHEGENESYICSLIRKDSIEEFVSFINQTNLQLSSEIKPSIFETNSFLIGKTPTLIEYASFFGSIQIIKYLLNNGVLLTDSLWLYIIHSNNAELINLLEENDIVPVDENYKKILYESIKCHHNEIANYIEENYIKSEDNIDCAFQFYNIEFIMQNIKDKFILFYLCKYNYFDLVKLIVQLNEQNVNIEMVLISSFFIKFFLKI